VLKRPDTVPPEILVVDDDPEIRHVLRTLFEREGFTVSEAADAKSTLIRLVEGAVGLVTLDLKLGSDDGLALMREIRARDDVPIIIMSGKGDTIDRVVGLELGADDYISKPFNLREVLARVRAVLRRHEPARAHGATITGSGPHERVQFDSWVLDVTSRELKKPTGEQRELTTGEFNLLELFVRRPHRALSRDEIMDLLKGHDWSPLDRSIDALVGRLRKKIEPDISSPLHIKTIRGVGYMFASSVKKI
jgi:DNA-binding response OmpR family regulator